MAHSGKSDDKKLQAQQRQDRLAAALRSNLHRRKAQVRGRAQRETPQCMTDGEVAGEPEQEAPAAGESPATRRGETA